VPVPSGQENPASGTSAGSSDADRKGIRSGLSGLLRRDMAVNEQLVVYGAAVLALVLGLVFSLPDLTTHHQAKNTSSPLSFLLASVGVFLVLSLSARYGRRTIASVASLLAAFAMGTILGFIYIALGAWLLFRNSRAQRANRSAAAAGRGATAGGTAGSRAREPRSAHRPTPGSTSRSGASRPNKRYTPPGTKGRRR
jgi:hypothetical protein